MNATLSFLPGFIAKINRFKRLFVSFKPGHKGDLVKMTISGWIKALIRSAYEKV
jgi:hypothetical protein